MGLVGPGFIAEHHLDAVRRLGDVEIVGIAGSSLQSAQEKAAKLKAGYAFRDYMELVQCADIDVVHNTTPNFLHREVSLAALRAGKHVISDKPLACTAKECAELRDAAAEADVVGAVTFNYRGHAMVQQARAMVAHGTLGETVSIHGQYLQDWLTDENTYSWRVDPLLAGPSSALADIAAHWCDLAEHVAGARIQSVLADLCTVVKTRYTANAPRATFSRDKVGSGTPVAVHGEDLAAVLLRFENGARGSLKVGQVLPGHKNDLQLEVNGRVASVRWEQEKPNELWVGSYAQPNCILQREAALLMPEAQMYAGLPVGHHDGWADAFRNVISEIYAWIRQGGAEQQRPGMVCSFSGGYRVSCTIEAMLKSFAQGSVWQDIEDPFPARANVSGDAAAKPLANIEALSQ